MSIIILILFQILILVFTGGIILLLDSIQFIYGLVILATLITILIQLLFKFRTNLLIVWQLAFLYITALEGFFHGEQIFISYGIAAIVASKYITLTYLLSVIGYLMSYSIKINNNTKIKCQESKFLIEYKPTNYTLPLIAIVYILYIFSNYQQVVSLFYQGRITSSGGGNVLSLITGSLNSTLSMILPSLLAFLVKNVYKRKKYILDSLIVSIPIILLLLLSGTRFSLLFSVGGLVIVLLGKIRIEFRQMVPLIFAGFIIIYITQLMLDSRVIGFYNYLSNYGFRLEGKFIELFYTREGITRAVSLAVNYFSTNPHTLGGSLGFIFIFWIPRKIWANKPVMLGHWLIREMIFTGYGDSHSISYGFSGEAYADFGFIGGLFFAFILGCIIQLISKIEDKITKDEFNTLYMAAIYPFVFFASRSLITSLMSLLGILIIIWLYKKTLISNKVIISKENKIL